jgi:neutral ceramidase
MTSIRVAAGTVDITPTAAVPLAGSEVRTADFTGVADRLEANVLVLQQEGLPVVIVSADLMFIGQELRSGVLQRLGGAVEEASLFFAASHTHFGPATDDRRPALGRLDRRYLDHLCERVSDLVARLLREPLARATIEYARGRASHAVNRRLRAAWHLSRRGPKIGAVVAAPNPAGPRDESMHLVRVTGSDGRPLALIWSYACHPVAFPQPLEVSADYPGRVRHRLRTRFDPALPVLFWQGFAGDIRPPELERPRSQADRVRRLLLGPRFGRFTAEEWDQWADSLADRLLETAVGTGFAPVLGPLHTRRVARPLSQFILGAPDAREVTFHRVSLGGLTAVGVSAEVVTEYGALVRAIFDHRISIPVGYIDEVYGYLPTSRMVREGGYEADWFRRPFALEGPVNPQIEAHCAAALRELAVNS